MRNQLRPWLTLVRYVENVSFIALKRFSTPCCQQWRTSQNPSIHSAHDIRRQHTLVTSPPTIYEVLPLCLIGVEFAEKPCSMKIKSDMVVHLDHVFLRHIPSCLVETSFPKRNQRNPFVFENHQKNSIQICVCVPLSSPPSSTQK